MKLTIHRLLELYGIDPSKVKLVRHSNAEIPVHETFKNDLARFENYQSFQNSNKFGKAAHVVSFSAAHGTSALFLGVWDIVGCTENSGFGEKHRQLIENYSLPSHWFNDLCFYHLQRNPALDELSERLVIEWGGSTVSWVQNKDKQVIELRRPHAIENFISYDSVQIGYQDLITLTKNKAANIDWINALSAVNGVYLIKDCSTGKLYVGSAYGEAGIWGRWSTYALNGHGGNTELVSLSPQNFEFSILEIVSGTASESEVIHRENRWKEKLGSRHFGLNQN